MGDTETLIESIEGSRDWTLKLVADLSGDDWTFQPADGLQHALWLCGHLASSQQTLVLMRCLGREKSDAEFMAHFPLGGSVKSAESATKILVIGASLSINGQSWASQGQEPGEKIFSGGAVKPESWDEASRMVLSGRISLDDHTAAVESLEDYRSAWDAVASGERFNSLLCVSRDLELL